MVLVVKAVHTFVAEHGDELEFQAGELIEVLEKDDAFGDGWWRGKNPRGEEGLFPATYITEEAAAEPAAVVADAAQSKAPGADAEAVDPAAPSSATIPTMDFSAPAPPIAEPSPVPAMSALSLTTSQPHSDTTKETVPAVQPAQPLEIPTPPSPKNVESNMETVDHQRGLLDTAVAAAGTAAAAAGTVMGRTLGEIQDAIEQIAKPESEDERDGEELGINSDARARLAAQAKKANEQRDKHISGGVTGLVYSDESDDEDDEVRSGGRNSFGVLANGMGNGNGVGSTFGNGHANGRAFTLDSPTEPLDPSRSFGAEGRRTSGLSGGARTPKDVPVDSSLQPALPLPATPPVLSKVGTGAGVSSKDVTSWTVEEVVAWVESKGFEDVICEKFREHEITGDLLVELDANLLKELDIPQFGKRLRIAQAIAELRRPQSTPSSQEMHSRGMSAPPSAIGLPASSTPPLTASPSSAPAENAPYAAWAHPGSRRTSSNTPVTAPSMEAIKEDKPHTQTHTPAQSTSISSVPNSPVTPSSGLTKRESTGSMGHKRGKPSIDNKDRLSFFGRNRKPAPSAPSPGDNKPRISAPGKVHQMQPATPEQSRKVSTVSAPGSAAALRQIGTPDHSGFMKKKGERIGWKTRFFVLKGAHLYYLKSEHEDKVKGHIDLRGYRVIVDENTNPGSYGFRLVGAGQPHAFSSAEQSAVREWMKALMKATIARDYTVPVTSSCNIPTIPLAEAQAMSPRPPSPATREATQRATRRENTNTLTAHDASILMSLDTTKRASQQLTPSRPSRDERRPSTTQAAPAPRPATMMSGKSSINDDPHSRELVQWVNSHLPPPYPKASSIPSSFASGEVIFLLVRSLSGIEPSPPVPPNAFAPEGGLPGLSGLFSMMDILIDAGVDTAGVSINDVRSGDKAQICRLIESVRAWQAARSGTAQ